jgi:hypothetical protein
MNTPRMSHREQAQAAPYKNLVTVVPRHDLTMEQVIQKARAGHEIIYTPHIGNKWREDQMMARFGFIHATVDRNAIGIDDIDTPHLIRVDGRRHEIVSHDPGVAGSQYGVLTPFATLDRMNRSQIAGLLGRDMGATPAQIHMESAKAALPEGSVDLQDRFLYLRGEIEAKVASILGAAGEREFCEVFQKHVVDGKSKSLAEPRRDKRAIREFLDLVEVIIRNVERGETRGAESPLPTNSAMIASMAVHALFTQQERGVSGAEQADVYTVSGPVMIGYMSKFAGHINALYHVARELHPELPVNVRYNVIPGSTFDFVPATSEREALELVTRIAAIERERDALGEALRQKTQGERAAIVARKNALGNEQDALKEQFLRVRKEMRFHSQYDVVRGEEPLADIADLRAIPFRRLAQLFHLPAK